MTSKVKIRKAGKTDIPILAQYIPTLHQQIVGGDHAVSNRVKPCQNFGPVE